MIVSVFRCPKAPIDTRPKLSVVIVLLKAFAKIATNKPRTWFVFVHSARVVVALFGPLSLLVLESVLIAAALQEGFIIVAYGRVFYIVFYY